MNAKGSSRPMSVGKKVAIVGSTLGIVGLVIFGGLLIGGRPAPPPPADPAAGRAAAEFCVNAIGKAIADKTVEASQPEPGRKFVRAIQYTDGAVRVIYDVQSGQSVENVEYSAAVFITSLFSESTSPAWRLFGEASEPWLRCTQALQYFEQEKAKDVARELQNWVFGPPPPSRTLAGTWTLARTVISCYNLEEGCASDPIEITFESCTVSQCLMSRDGVWGDSHAILRGGSGTWSAQFVDIAFACGQTGPRTLNPGSYTMSFSVDNAVEVLTGAVSYTADSNAPCSGTSVTASYEFVGRRL